MIEALVNKPAVFPNGVRTVTNGSNASLAVAVGTLADSVDRTGFYSEAGRLVTTVAGVDTLEVTTTVVRSLSTQTAVSPTTGALRSAGGLGVADRIHGGSTVAAGAGQYTGAMTTQGGLRAGYGLGRGSPAAFISSGDLGLAPGADARYTAYFTNAQRGIDGSMTVGVFDAAAQQGVTATLTNESVGVHGRAKFTGFNECQRNLIGVRGTASNSSVDGGSENRPHDRNAIGLDGRVFVQSLRAGSATGVVYEATGARATVNATGSQAIGAGSERSAYGSRAAVTISGIWTRAAALHGVVTATGDCPVAYGVYGKASGAARNWAGYFEGDIASHGFWYIGGEPTEGSIRVGVIDGVFVVQKLEGAEWTTVFYAGGDP